jgi:hypothetical protein
MTTTHPNTDLVYSSYYNYTSIPFIEIQQDVANQINILKMISKDDYDNIMIIIGGSYWDYDKKFNIICKEIRYSLQNYKEGNNLIINIDGDDDLMKPCDNDCNKYIHLKLYLSHREDCPFNFELYKFIEHYLESNTNIYIINSVFQYSSLAFSNKNVIKVFKKYKNYIKIINYTSLPSNKYNNYYNASILTKLVTCYKKEYNYWKKVYQLKYDSDFKNDNKCNNLKIVTFDDILIYLFNL